MDVEKSKQEIENAEVGDIFEVSTEKHKKDKIENNEFKLVVGETGGKQTVFHLAEDVEEAGVEKSHLPLPTWGEKLENVPDDKLFAVFHVIISRPRSTNTTLADELLLHSHEGKYSFAHGYITELEKNGNIFD